MEPDGPTDGMRALSAMIISSVDVDIDGLALTAIARRGIVWELYVVSVAVVSWADTVFPMSESKKEKRLACAVPGNNTGNKTIAKVITVPFAQIENALCLFFL